MAYKKKNFENGHILTAEDLNYMETGIEAAHEGVEDFNVANSNITPTYSYLTIQKGGELYEVPVLRSDSGQDGEHELRYRHLPSATAYKKGAVIVDLQMSDISENPVQNATVKMYVDNSIYESLKDVLKGNVTGDAPVRRFELTNGYMIPILEDEKLKPMHLPLADEYQRGAITSEDKVALDQLKGLLSNEVVEGTYGGFESECYNIPNVKVDEYGRIIEASNSVLPKASAESDGYISADDYVKIGYAPTFLNPIINENYIKILAGQTMPISCISGSGYSALISYFDSAGVEELPTPLRVVAIGEYTDSDGNTWVIPVNWRAKKVFQKGTYLYHEIQVFLSESIEYDVTVKIYANYKMSSLM